MTKQIKKDAIITGIVGIIAGLLFVGLGICFFVKNKGSLTFDTDLSALLNWEVAKPLVIFCLIELAGLINILLGILSIKYGAEIKPETTFRKGLYIVVLVLTLLELFTIMTISILFRNELAPYLTVKFATISLVFGILNLLRIILSIKTMVNAHKVASKIHN